MLNTTRIKVRKGLWLLLVIVLSQSLILAGCSPKDTGATTESTKANNETKKPEAEKKEKITVSVYERGNIPPEEGSAIKNRWTDWINENGPVDAEFVAIPRGEEYAKFNTLFASGSAPDLIFTWNSGVINTLLAQKQLLPLDELIDKNSNDYKQLLDKYPALKKLGIKSDGKIYTFGMVLPYDVEGMLLVRADWLKKLKLEVPKTTEELHQVIKAFTEEDPDGNNKKDTFGIQLSASGGYMIDHMFGVDAFYKITKDDQFSRIFDQEAAVTVFKKTLYDEGLVDKDYLTDKDGAKAQQDFVNGKLGILGAHGANNGIGLQVYETLKTNNPNAEVIAIPLPKSEFGQFSTNVNPPLFAVAAINANAKNPEAVMKYIDFIVRESTAKTLKYGLEGTHYKVGENGCPQPIDTDKNKKELSWTADLRMLSFEILEGKCADYLTTLDMNKPIQKDYAEIVKQAREAYMSADRPIYYDIDYASMPNLTQDLETAWTNATTAVFDIYAKAVVGGPKYTAAKAAEDAKEAWDRAGGKQLDAFYAEWYTDNKNNIVYTKDYLSMKP